MAAESLHLKNEPSQTMNLIDKKIDRLLLSFNKKYRRFIDAKFHKIPATKSALGFLFSGNESMISGSFEVEETHLIKKLLQSVDVFVNVGANIGYYCCLSMQENVPVIAFEPESQNLKFLLKNIQANGWENDIEVYPLGAGRFVGIANMYSEGTGASLIKGWSKSSSDLVASIPISSLDLVIGDRLANKKTLVLIDIEGAEYSALLGCSKLVSQINKPIWVVEICTTQHQPSGVQMNPHFLETFSFFWDNGYAAYTATLPTKPISKDEILKIHSKKIDTLKVHNFIFVEQNIDINTLL
jgi:FkbM family methyltransferase